MSKIKDYFEIDYESCYCAEGYDIYTSNYLEGHESECSDVMCMNDEEGYPAQWGVEVTLAQLEELFEPLESLKVLAHLEDWHGQSVTSAEAKTLITQFYLKQIKKFLKADLAKVYGV